MKKQLFALAAASVLSAVMIFSAQAAAWQQNGTQWSYIQDNGTKAVGWQMIGGYWYYLDPGTGYMHTGWLTTDGSTWYLLGGDGKMATGWALVNGSWYYLDSNGSMHKGIMKGEQSEGTGTNDFYYYYLDPTSGALWVNREESSGSNTLKYDKNGRMFLKTSATTLANPSNPWIIYDPDRDTLTTVTNNLADANASYLEDAENEEYKRYISNVMDYKSGSTGSSASYTTVKTRQTAWETRVQKDLAKYTADTNAVSEYIHFVEQYAYLYTSDNSLDTYDSLKTEVEQRNDSDEEEYTDDSD